MVSNSPIYSVLTPATPQYSSGSFLAVSLSPQAPHLAPVGSTSISFSGTGPDTARQEGAHLHQVAPHPTYDELLVPDLGSDKTRRLVKGADGKWEEKGAIEYAPGSGPRHVAFHGTSSPSQYTHPISPPSVHPQSA